MWSKNSEDLSVVFVDLGDGLVFFFFKKKAGQSRPLFVYFRSFLVTIPIQIEKSINGVLGIPTRGRRMVGADETTELWWPPRVMGCVIRTKYYFRN